MGSCVSYIFGVVEKDDDLACWGNMRSDSGDGAREVNKKKNGLSERLKQENYTHGF